ncbi:MAG: hypothetical protein K2X66_03760, partial [Cyanobacteria bacterium]|nr:hypothetical protein [Cyanobacteriota bacterium]
FDALPKPSLNSQDLESSAASTRLYQKLGAGFKMKDPATGITYMFRRSFMMACHTELGTLVIRNSSPEFGRDTMKHPAYYLPVEVPDLQMETFDPGKIPEKWHILNKSLYASDVLGEEGNTQDKIAALSDALMGIKDRYRRFKLDTESFEGYGADRHFSGHLSPGFVPLVNHLLKLCPLLEKQGKPLPDLAFAHPEFPLFQPYGRFPLTPGHLKELRDFASGSWSSVLYPNSEWLEFLTKMGVNNRAELVIVSPEEG